MTFTNVGGEPVDPTRDRPGLVLQTILGATLAGTSSVALVLWGVRTILAQAPASDQPVATGPAFPLLIGGVLASTFLAAGVAWHRLAILTATWRRGVFAMVSAIATMVAALAATPVDYYFGRGALLVLSVGAGILAIIVLYASRIRA